MYTLTVTSPPAQEPVSTATAASFLRLNTSTENSLLAMFVTGARQRFEREAQIGLITQTITQSIQYAPRYETYLMTGPIQSINSVTYYDQNGNLQTASGYSVDIVTGGMARVWWPNGGQPNMSSQVSPVMMINATIGFGTEPSSVPIEIVNGILTLVDHWFFNRSAFGDSMSPTPATFDDAVAKYGLGVFGQWQMDRRHRRGHCGNGWPWAFGGFGWGWW
jgi:uncharacterized phiE125 gp8 family phage protein